jgi:3-oxoacyl-[acyl-carrier-protein] synthase-1
MRELPGGGKCPTGQIRKELPAAAIPELPGPVAFAGGTRIIRIINAALEQIRPAVEEALSRYGPEKMGVCFGTCDNGSEGSLLAHRAFLERGVFPQDYQLRFQSAAFPAEFIARKFGVSGPAYTIATACASSASAIVRGAELIRAGLCGAVIAGGADVVSDTVLAGFHALEAVSSSLCNPFSKNRKGINLGEGAAFFLLDAAEISAVGLLGAGESADGFHMTAPGADGEGPAKAMKAALLDAGLEPAQIGYVNLHGTGTALNDKAEALAMRKVFGRPPPSSATKPITGHTLGAAGALEAAICWMALNERRGLPLHCGDGVFDDELGFYPEVPSGVGSRESGEFPQKPGEFPQSPGGFPQSPGGLTQSPGGLTQSPGGLTQMPGEFSQNLGEHSQNLGEHSQNLGEHSQNPGEHSQSPGEHSQSPGEHSQNLGEHSQNLGEHSQSPGEFSQKPEHWCQAHAAARRCQAPLSLFPLPSSLFPTPLQICMSNSFAFGGCNVSLILGRR